MVEIVLVLSMFCVAAIALARCAPTGNVAVVFFYAVIFLFASGMAWVMALQVHAVPIDAIDRRSFGIYDLQPWLRTVFLGPPILGALVFAAALWNRGRHRQ